jgi:hypothetical protein
MGAGVGAGQDRDLGCVVTVQVSGLMGQEQASQTGLSGQLQAGLLAMHEGEAPACCGPVMNCQSAVLYPWMGLLLVGLVGQLRGLVGFAMG